MKTEFDAFVENASASEEHAQEIKQTRVGGLGGSDAAMVMKIGRDGMAALSNTDIKRLAVMLGQAEQEDWSGNAYTNAGHKFEDWCDKTVPFGNGWKEREHVMEQPLAKNFKTFAHADFAYGNFMQPNIVECKFVTTKTTDQVKSTYYAQLQWYYMLGAKMVHLLHGMGTVDDAEAGTEFEVEETKLELIERDEDAIKMLVNGIKLIDKAIADGWQPIVREKASLMDAPDVVAEAFRTLTECKERASEIKEQEAQAKEVVREYMDAFGYNGIVSDEHQVVLTSGKTTTTFNLKAFKAAVESKAAGKPMLALTLDEIFKTIEECQKTTVSAPSITFK